MKADGIVDILMVEDNQYDAELIIRALKMKIPVKNLLVIDDGAEALDFFFCQGKYSGRKTDQAPRVVLLDLKLPKINGLEIIKAIKSDSKTSGIPIVVLTSSQEESDIKEAYRLGTNSYIVKPLDFDHFADTIGQVGMYWMMFNKTPQ